MITVYNVHDVTNSGSSDHHSNYHLIIMIM